MFRRCNFYMAPPLTSLAAMDLDEETVPAVKTACLHSAA
jgi:hypothetical protein